MKRKSLIPRFLNKFSKSWATPDRWILMFSFLFCAGNVVAWKLQTFPIVSYILLGLTNLYLILVLIVAAMKSDEFHTKTFGDQVLPHKVPGLFIFIFILASTVFGFATLLKHEAAVYATDNQALYECFISITSFSYETNLPNATRGFKKIQMWESASALLVFTGAFGLLLSRLADYKENGQPTLTNNARVDDDKTKDTFLSFSNYSEVIKEIKIKVGANSQTLEKAEELKIIEMKLLDKTDEQIKEFFTQNGLSGSNNTKLTTYLQSLKDKQKEVFNSRKADLKKELNKALGLD